MMKLFLSCLLTSFIITLAAPKQNLIYISIDGTSRDTLYALLQKNRLPNLATIKKTGNVKNMSISTANSTETFPTYYRLLSGQHPPKTVQPIPEYASLFDIIKTHRANTQIGTILSTPQNLDAPEDLSSLLHHFRPLAALHVPQRPRNATDVTEIASEFVRNTTTPFALFFNLTDVDYAGHKTRSGAQAYSTSLKTTDKALGTLITTLKKTKKWDNTLIVITTNYSFFPKSRKHSPNPNSWILANVPIRYKGTQLDIVPTILHLLRIKADTTHDLPGKKLVY